MVTDEQRDRMIRNDPLDEALAMADRIRGYARPTVGEHAALRLAVEVRDLQARVADLDAEQAVGWHRVAELESAVRCTCNYAGMEGERHKDFCEIEGGPHVECQKRIAELESEVRNLTYDRDGAQERVAELEKRHERDAEDLTMYERWAKNSPAKEVDCSCGRVLSVRIADADLNTSTGTDWAARWPAQQTDHETGIDRDVTSWDLTGETYARRVHAQYPRETELVARTNGPWRVVQ
jgi:hypothetical protein